MRAEPQQPGPSAISEPSLGTETGTLSERCDGEAVPLQDSSAAQRVFFPNELIAGRYTVVRLLGRGGMGEVYEARDLVLGHRVALKTLRADRAVPGHSERSFKSEVLLARQVTHPNICRLFDLSHHSQAKSPDAGKTPFLSMELLDGETLAQRLRAGAMPTCEALPVILQLSDALSAAHRAGVLHLDLKASNVIMVPDGAEQRAVITDFGIARARSGGQAECEQEWQQPGGTPTAMAPEQWQGRPVSEATDVYALGLMICEMVCGANPLSELGDHPSMLLTADRLQTFLQTHALELDSRWVSVIRRCLESEPGARFASAGEVAAALQPPTDRPAPTRSRQRLLLLLMAAVVAALTLIAVAATNRLVVPDHQASAAVTAAARRPQRSVAVLGFRDLADRPDDDWLSNALAEMLTTELAAGGRLRTIPQGNIALACLELALPESGPFGDDNVRQLSTNLGAEVIVLGSYLAPQGERTGSLRFEAQAREAASGEIVAAVATTGSVEELIDVVSRLGAGLRQGLGATALSSDEAGELLACQPSSARAARLYSEGLALLHRFDATPALALLQAATAEEPDFALAHLALADAWIYLGFEEESRREAEVAASLADPLPREARLWVRARRHVANYEWDQALELYQALWTFFPHNLEYGLKLACTQTMAGRTDDALATIEQLRQLPEPLSLDPRIDLTEAETARAIPDLERQRQAATRALTGAAARQASLVEARANLQLGRALTAMGELEPAATALASARRVFESVGDSHHVVETLITTGWLRHYQGDQSAARQTLAEAVDMLGGSNHQGVIAQLEGSLGSLLATQGDQEGAAEHLSKALQIYRRTAQRRGIAETQCRIAGSQWALGRLGEAQARYEEALSEYRLIAAPKEIGATQLNIGYLLMQQGRVSEAVRICGEARTALASYGNRRLEMGGLNLMATAAIESGALEEAERCLRQALGIAEETSDHYFVGLARFNLGHLAMITGKLTEARRHSEEAVARYRQIHAAISLAWAQLLLAEIELEAGLPAAVEERVGEALAAAGEGAPGFVREWAQALLAESLALQSRPEEALAAVQCSLGSDNAPESLPHRCRVQIRCARALLACGRADEARSLLRKVLSHTGSGMRAIELEARLPLASAEQQLGTPGAELLLSELAREARGRGFVRIAEAADTATLSTSRSPAASS